MRVVDSRTSYEEIFKRIDDRVGEFLTSFREGISYHEMDQAKDILNIYIEQINNLSENLKSKTNE